MRIKTELPRATHKMQDVWIPMSDGARLAATIWLPVDAEERPVPAVFECDPYRKNDFTGGVDARQRYTAGHGYAWVKMDIRGSGDSDGILHDEYLPQEQNDAVEAIAWIAAQSWCTGKVGMTGISWSGFNSLQVAALRPPSLKAIITLCSTDDRYADDVHYMGGCLLANDMLVWASVMLAYSARPPLPDVNGDRWREIWLDRIERTPPFIEAWVGHQRRDEFWKQGSVCEDFSAIECPVYAVGGWADGYTNAIPRMIENLPGVRKGLIGPWAHAYPHVGGPGPQIGFLQECLRWWDRWLKDVDNGIEDEPMLRVWMQDSILPAVTQPERPGRWREEPTWPSPNVGVETYALNAMGLQKTAGKEAELKFRGPLASALDGGIWCPHGGPGDFAGDQRAADGMSLTFTSEPVTEPIEILGYPELALSFASDRPQALVAVRLCDLAPTGESTLISVGLLNLSHRDSHEFPELLEPGKRYETTVRLNVIGYVVPAGHRLSVSVSPNYFPWAWPSPEPVTLSVFTGASVLRLPTRTSAPGEVEPQPFAEPETVDQVPPELLKTGGRQMTVRRDQLSGHVELKWERTPRVIRLPSRNLELGTSGLDSFSIIEGEPLSATLRSEHSISIGRPGWRTRVETSSVLTSDATTFHLTNAIDAYEGETRIRTKTWYRSIPRDHV